MTVSHQVSIRVAAQCLVAVKYGTSPTLDGGSYTAEVSSGAERVAKFTLTGLTPGARYYYAALTNGNLSATIGTFLAAPTPGSAASFRFAAGGCVRHDPQPVKVWSALAAEPDLLFLLQYGDLHYENPQTTDPAAFRGYYDNVMARQAAPLLRDVPLVYTWDNHDCDAQAKDVGRNGMSVGAGQVAYRQVVPTHPLRAGDSLERAFTVGRVRFIITDTYSHRDPLGFTPAAGQVRTTFGTAQREWIKQELLDAQPVHGCAITLLVFSTPMYEHSSYSAERTQIYNHIRDNSLGGRVFMLSGDTHVLGMDDGTSQDFSSGSGAVIPLLVSSAMNVGNDFSTFGANTFSEGGLVNPASGGYYAVVDITDTGGATITMTWSGRQVVDGAEVMTMTFQVPVP